MANERARALRKSMSEPERLLWGALRNRNLDGARFRRQHPIGPYVADFVCLEARLVVEVDGSQHGEPEQAAHDATRTRWLEGEGYRVVRVWAGEVFANLGGVKETISAALKAVAPSPPVTPTSRAEDHLDPPLVVVAETEPEPAGLSDGAASSPHEGEG